MEPAENDFKKRLEFFKNLEKGNKGSVSKTSSETSTANQKDPNQIAQSRIQRNTLPVAKSTPVKTEELKVLVIGPSGAGKSSFINLLYTWSKIDFKIEELPNLGKLLIPTQHFEGESTTEQNVQDISKSQTTTPNLYSFDCDRIKQGKTYHIQILDTPGLRDTRGIQQDDRNVDAIIDEVISKTPDLNAILVMLNGTQARIDSSVNYVLTKLNNMIPDAWRNSIFYLLSNVGFASNMQLNFEHNKENVFQYDNPIFRISKDALRKPTQEIKKIYENAAKKMKEMLLKMTGCSVKPTTDFAKIKEGRDLLKQKLAEYSDLATTFHHLKANLNEILSQSSTLKLSEIQQKLTAILTQKYTTGIHSEQYNTLCLACKISCHESCNCLTAKNCSSFVEEGNCSVCSHGYNMHVRIQRKFQTNTKKLQNFDEIKNLQAEEQVRKFTQDCIEKFDNDLRYCYLDVLQSSLSLKQLCSHFDYFKELATSLQLLDEQIYLAQRTRGSKYKSLVETREKLKKLHDTLLETQNNDYLREATRTQAEIEIYLEKQRENPDSAQHRENLEKKEEQEIQYTLLDTQPSTMSGTEEEEKQKNPEQTNEVKENETKTEVVNEQSPLETKEEDKIEQQDAPKLEQSLEQKEEQPQQNLESLEQRPQSQEIQPETVENGSNKNIEISADAEMTKEENLAHKEEAEQDQITSNQEGEAVGIQRVESNLTEPAAEQIEQHEQPNPEQTAEKILQEEEKHEAQPTEPETLQQSETNAQDSWQQYIEYLLNNDKKITSCAFIERETGNILASKDVKLSSHEKDGKVIDEKKIVLEIFDHRNEIYKEFLGHVHINGLDYLVVKENEDNSFALRSLSGGGAKLVRTSRLILFAHFSSGFLDVPNVVDNLATYFYQFDW